MQITIFFSFTQVIHQFSQDIFANIREKSIFKSNSLYKTKPNLNNLQRAIYHITFSSNKKIILIQLKFTTVNYKVIYLFIFTKHFFFSKYIQINDHPLNLSRAACLHD